MALHHFFFFFVIDRSIDNMDITDTLSVSSLNVGGSIQEKHNLALTRCCEFSGCCHCKSGETALPGSMEVLSGEARPLILSDDRCQRRTSETKPCESGFVESHFHSEDELQVELFSCGCCDGDDGDDPCPHGYGYDIISVDDFMEEQSTIFQKSNDAITDACTSTLSNPVKLTKNQKKNLKRRAKKKSLTERNLMTT